MPAKTINQLSPILENFIEPGTSFLNAMAEALPRLYSLGFWKDLSAEVTLDASHGYVTLPMEAEAVINSTIDGFPVPTRSLWHSVRIVGRNATLSRLYGCEDAGFYPNQWDNTTIQDTDEPVGVPTIAARDKATGLPVNVCDYSGVVSIALATMDGNLKGATQSTIGDVAFECGELDTEAETDSTMQRILSVIYSNSNLELELYDPNFPDLPITTVPQGSGMVRLRRFKVHSMDTDTDSYVHFLVKRACPENITPNTVVHLSSLGAIKNGLLGILAESNADVDRASYHFGLAEKLLDDELDAFRGGAKPTATIDLWGGTPPPVNPM